jgi:3-phenylpropionate/trans-cinnamate dioxygenase ferredoxin component
VPKLLGALKVPDVPPGAMRLVGDDGSEIVVANVDGQFCAFGNVCPHEGGPLVEGELDGDGVICPWHFTRFDVRTGEAIEGVTDEPIPVYEVTVEGDQVLVHGPAAV